MVGWIRALNPLAFIRIKYTTTRLNETFEALYLIAQCCYLQIFGVGLVLAEIKQLIEKSTHMNFVYPHEAYTYRISLLSAGVKELDFYNLKLEETGEEHV